MPTIIRWVYKPSYRGGQPSKVKGKFIIKPGGYGERGCFTNPCGQIGPRDRWGPPERRCSLWTPREFLRFVSYHYIRRYPHYKYHERYTKEHIIWYNMVNSYVCWINSHVSLSSAILGLLSHYLPTFFHMIHFWTSQFPGFEMIFPLTLLGWPPR